MKMSRSLLLVTALLLAGCSQASEGSEDVQSADEALHGNGNAPVTTVDHFVHVSSGATIHVVEKYTKGSLFQGNRRALLMLSGTLVDSREYNLPSPYNALDIAARAGYFAYAIDYEGYGQSSHPPDGKVVTKQRLLQESGEVVEWIRHSRHIRRVNLLGSSLGSSLAVELGGGNGPINRHHVGKLVLTSVVYKNVTPEFQQAFFSPAFQQLLLTIPGGYIQTPAEAYGPIVIGAAPAAANSVLTLVPDVYAVGPTLEGFTLPIYPAQDGRNPAMQFWGDQDPITPLSDVQQFQSEYGGNISYRVVSGSGHIPFYSTNATSFWNGAFAFLDGDCFSGGYDGVDDSTTDGAGIEVTADISSSKTSDAPKGCVAW